MALLDETRVRPRSREARWPSASDDALVRGAITGADGAFDEIFARYHAPLVRYCRGILLDDDLAQDAAQNALAAALRALQGGRSTPQALGPWLYRIAQREAFDLSRRRRQDAAARQFDGPDGEEALLQVAAPNDERVRERLRELVGDLSRLPLRQRSALMLRELSGLGYADIAIALDTTPAAARQSVLEARTALVDVGDGRRDSCSDVRALIDSGDRRKLRGRRVQAHLSDCTGCRGFAGRIDDRRRDLALLFPLAPALASGSGALAIVTGGGVAAGGAGVAAGGWSLGLGSLGSAGVAKCAVACTAALVGVGAIGEQVVVHPPAKKPRVEVVAQAPQPSGSVASPSATAAPTPSARKVRAKAPARAATGAAASKAKAKPARTWSGGSAVAVRIPARTGSGSAAPAATSTTAAGGTAPADPAAQATTSTPAAVSTPSPAPSTVAATPVSMSGGTTNKTQAALAGELQKKTSEVVAQLTAQTGDAVKNVVEGSLAVTQQTLSAVQKTVQNVTNTALSGVQAQLEALKRLIHPQSQP
ncbi:hypothetical protein DSM112329_00412 [Paraconexibacter sp. AEG42_29]|uniref:Sigma-70 family RNA polymerase sigma factor n=1 Tax=Paraconexibacter sp. AEG42_29 TaxID=2997339 RepID=A0AAU7AQE8_9ACTN